jgi:EmrB/QacA subfamily drug resistance transporter
METGKPSAGWITTGLLLGLILSSLEQTIVATAMPSVMKELGGLSHYSWVFSVYMLASTTSMPIYGKLADLFGRRAMFVTGMLLFLTGSACCGFAGTMTELIVFRGIQGLGAGALMPIAFTIIADIYPPEKIGKFQGLFGTVFAVSSILGPALGGAIAEHADWGWIFWLNLPLGIPSLVIVFLTLRESKRREKRSIDWLGAITLSGTIVSLLLALEPEGTRGLFGVSAVLLLLFLWVETKAKDPIVPLQLFRIRAIAFGNIAGFFVSAGLFSSIAYIPLFFQGVIGVSPSVAGYILTPLMLSTVITSNIGGRLMSKASYRAILVPSLVLMAAGLFGLSQMTVEAGKWKIILSLIVTGLGMGAIYPVLGTAAARAVDAGSRGAATASSQFFRSIGGTIGVSVLGSLLLHRMTSGATKLGAITGALSAEQLHRMTDPKLLLDTEARASLPPEVVTGLQHVFTDALSSVFTAGLIFVGIALLASVMLGNTRLVQASVKG